MSDLSAFLNPKRIAVIGASPDVGKIRGRLVKVLKSGNYDGEIIPINPGYPEIQGLKAYPDLASVPGTIDMAMIAVPGENVMQALRDCATRGVGSALIYSATLPGVTREVAEFAKSSKTRVIGPNAMGFVNFPEKIFATFSSSMDSAYDLPRPKPGPFRPVSVVSQSGSVGFALGVRALDAGVPVDKVVATGNEADVDCLEAVDHIVGEGRSAAIMLFVEGFKNPRAFFDVASRAADAGIPLIAMKVGRSEAGSRAAISHTAHLTGSDAVYDAIFERYGVIRVEDAEQMVAAAACFSLGKTPAGNRVAIATTTGGNGGWTADLCSALGLKVPSFPPHIQDELRKLVPEFGSSDNPVDMTPSLGGPDAQSKLIARMMRPDCADMVAMIRPLVEIKAAAATARALAPLLASSHVPLLLSSPSTPPPDSMNLLLDAGAYVLSLRGIAFGFSALSRYRDFQTRWRAERSIQTSPPVNADFGDLNATLRAYDVPLPPEALTQSADDAARAARVIGFPVALKVISSDLPHKTEAGALALNLQSESEVREAFVRIKANAQGFKRDAKIDGVQVQKMMPPGREMVVGINDDPDFGPVVLLGFGGVYVEVLKDVVIAPAPVTFEAAKRMIGKLRAAALLDGVRGEKPGDREALAQLLVNIGRLARDATGKLRELDLNPVVLYPEGLAVVDSLAVWHGDQPKNIEH